MNRERNKSLELFDDLLPSIKYSQLNYRLTNLIGPNSFDKFYKKLKQPSHLKLGNDLRELVDEKYYKFHHKGQFKAFNLDVYLKNKKVEDKKEEIKLSLRKKKIHIYFNERTIENVQKMKERIEKFKNETPFCKYNPKYEYISKRIPNVYIVPEHSSCSVSRSNITNNNENLLTGKSKYQIKVTNENNPIKLRKMKFKTTRFQNTLDEREESKTKLIYNYKILNKGTIEKNKTIQKCSSLPLLTVSNKIQKQGSKILCFKKLCK